MTDKIELTPEQLSILKRLDANILVAESNLIDAQQQRVKWISEQDFNIHNQNKNDEDE